MKNRGSVINYYLLVLWRIFLVYALYTVSRVVFIILNYNILKPISTGELFRILGGGLMFDNTAILYTNSLFLLMALLPAPFVFSAVYQKIVKWVYVIFNFIPLSINLADCIYFKFTLRRTSFSFVQEFQGDVKFGKIFLESITLYWYIFIIGLLFLAVLIFLSGSYKKQQDFFRQRMFNAFNNFRPYVIQFIALAVAVPLIIIGIRGGVTRTIRPITLSNAGDYVDKAIHTSAVLNTPFSLIRTAGKRQYTIQKFYPSYEAMEQIYTPLHLPALEERDSTSIFPVTSEKKNVVILILESFGAENIQFLNRSLPTNFTPFLDSLRRDGILCTNAFANGRKSIDAVPSIMASIPTLMESFAVTPYANDAFRGLPRILDSLGYYTAFFHGAPNNSMGLRAVTNLCGVKNYYGKDEYGNNSDFDGSWGIWDHKFLPFVAKTISTFKEPFYASVFTLSSHHPFKIPAEYKNVFPKGEIPLQETIAYVDNALKHFFATVCKEPWFKNTIFVITPDHSTWNGYMPKYSTLLGTTQIPIIYYAPGFIPCGEYSQTTQQIDIMPTVLGMLGYSEPFIAFGRNLAASNKTPFAVNFGGGEFQMVQGDTLYIRDMNTLKSVYDYKQDSLLNNNLLKSGVVQYKDVESKDDFFKAVVQQYMNRLIEDKLLVKSASDSR